MNSQDVLELVHALQQAGIEVWLNGGWGVVMRYWGKRPGNTQTWMWWWPLRTWSPSHASFRRADLSLQRLNSPRA
jgi:hypothetical protein